MGEMAYGAAYVKVCSTLLSIARTYPAYPANTLSARITRNQPHAAVIGRKASALATVPMGS